MKQLFLIFAGGIITTLTITNSAYAQQSSDSGLNVKDSLIYAKNDKPRGSMFDVTPAGSSAENKVISKKAIKNFSSGFEKAEDVKWFPLKDGFVAYCNLDAKATRVYYDKRGIHRYTTQSYDEKQMPRDVRGIVKRTYYDFTIYGVLQVDAENKTVYLVYIKDENSFKTIRVCDGEMDEYESHDYLRHQH